MAAVMGLTACPQGRQLAGAPAGGQFTTARRAEPDTELPVVHVSVQDVYDELDDLEARDQGRYAYAAANLGAAIQAYAGATGHDLAGADLVLEPYDVASIDPGYNFTAANSVVDYEAHWVATGRLHGEDLEWQVAWYASLVDAARAGTLPPVLVHEVDGVAVIVDGGHRLSAHRAAGISRIAAYVSR